MSLRQSPCNSHATENQFINCAPACVIRLHAACCTVVLNVPDASVTTSFEQGPNGPLVPELKEMFPEAPYIARPGQINAWDNEDFVKAVKATGRKQIIIVGVSGRFMPWMIRGTMEYGFVGSGLFAVFGGWCLERILNSTHSTKQAPNPTITDIMQSSPHPASYITRNDLQ